MSRKKKFYTKIITSYKDEGATITVSLHLYHKKLRDYNYKLLRFDQNIGDFNKLFDFELIAFNNPEQSIKEVHSKQDFENALEETFVSSRMGLIIQQIETLAEIVEEYQ